jgi:hypothetical protein
MVRVSDDAWAFLADQFVDGAYESVKGKVRTYVLVSIPGRTPSRN